MTSALNLSFSVSDGVAHVYAMSVGDTAAEALTAVNDVFEWIGNGKRRLVRIAPYVVSEKNFETGKMEHAGRVRFSFMKEDGEDTQTTSADAPLSLAGFGRSA